MLICNKQILLSDVFRHNNALCLGNPSADAEHLSGVREDLTWDRAHMASAMLIPSCAMGPRSSSALSKSCSLDSCCFDAPATTLSARSPCHPACS